jgi:glycosyltransferase involved in cell wall biosynthesis
LRIGVNLSFLGCQYSGIASYSKNLLGSMAAAGHELVVYSSSSQFDNFPRLTRHATPDQLRIENGGLRSLQRFLWMQTVLPKLLSDDGAELFISPTVEGILKPRVPQIVVVHDLLPLFYREECPRQYYYYKYVLPTVLKNAALAISVSEYTRQDLLKVYSLNPARVAVAPSGFKDMRALPKSSDDDLPRSPYFLFVGTFSPRKNVVTVIRAFAEISNQVAEKLVIVAYPDQWQGPIQELARSLSLTHRIHFLSAVSDSTLAHLYRNATALILLSEYEGFGMPPIEAMALGTPAIVSDSTSLSEVVGDAAIKVGCKDIAAASSAMYLLSTDPACRRKFSEAGSRHASRYTLEAAGHHLLECLEHLCPINVSAV